MPMNYFYDQTTKEFFTDKEIIKKHPNTSFPQRPWDGGVLHYKIAPLVIEDGDAPFGYADLRLIENGDSSYVYKALAGSKGARDSETMTTLKTEMHNRRRELRTVAETSGFEFNGHPLDSDRDSILRIANAAISAMIADKVGLEWSTVWRCADGYDMMLGINEILMLQASLANHGQSCHTKSQQLRIVIDSAPSIEDLKLINLEDAFK